MSEPDFDTSILPEQLEILIDLGTQFGFDPLGSSELERYFVALLERSAARGDQPLEEWLRLQVAPAFRSVAAKPVWVQGAKWPLLNGRPLVFIGQVDIDPAPGVTGRETSFYLFLDPDSWETRTVVQD